ncbi:hypothetical protein B1222_00280 [Paenibacillus larvae subsp. pulvifaciens]|nr:hypothetical protein B1222_00280 [Paenibacillus larvae subsp. pulvifaciens]
MHVGDWVSLAYKGEITRGFILRKSESEVKIQVTSTLHGARASEIITVPEGIHGRLNTSLVRKIYRI